MITTKNPYNFETINTYDLHTASQVDRILENAVSAFNSWKNDTITKRTKLLTNASKLLLKNKAKYANIITTEMGKPITQSLNEIDKCITACDFYAENAEQFLADAIIESEASESFISYDPLGTLLAIMPWNYPFWQVIRFAAPNITAGNAIILKHATNTTGCAMELQQLFIEAGYPEGCFQTVLIDHEDIEHLVSHESVKGVTLTGSEKAGRSVAALAGKHLKKSVMELGGNNACIIWEDADLNKYMETIVNARMQNTGQSCIAAKRYIVVDAIYDKFIEMLKQQIQLKNAGNPIDPKTEIGVIAREDLVKTLEDQVRASVNKGAKLTYGHETDGNFFEPTILENVSPGMPAFDDELFGPVASVIHVKDRNASIEMATKSKFGLGTMLFTEDLDAAHKLVGTIPDGAFFINEMVKSNCQLPFGGTKNSGYGRELSKEGMLEFTNKKTVYIK